MPDKLVVATWNINSVRLRIDIVKRLLEEQAPDVLCLQETKCPDADFPEKAFRQMGYEHLAIRGQKGYHGVAIVSKRPFVSSESRDFCSKGDARHLVVSVPFAGEQLSLHNFYVPAGGDDPDPVANDKFAHKLAFLEEMKGWLTGPETAKPAILVGDLNVAPLEEDVWSHKQLLKVVSHTPVETDLLKQVQSAGDWIDVMRRFVPDSEKLYTWWSYRAKDWRKANKGRRLDHIWASAPLDESISDMRVLLDARGWEKPSDHAPIIAEFEA